MASTISYYIYKFFLYSDARAFWRQCGLAIVLLLGIWYFNYHKNKGDFGVDAKYLIETRITDLQERNNDKKEAINSLERQVLSLSSQPDIDKIDEEIRKNLNYAHPDEYIIMLK